MPDSTIKHLEALIVPAEARHFFTNWKGPASAAWQLSSDRPDRDPHRDVYICEADESGQWEALVGALLTIVVKAPSECSIEVFCAHKAFCDSINVYLHGWREGGWKKPPKCNAEWQHFAKMCEQKHVTVTATHVAKCDQDWADDLSVLREITRDRLGEHARKLGYPWGGFDEVPGGYVASDSERKKRRPPSR